MKKDTKTSAGAKLVGPAAIVGLLLALALFGVLAQGCGDYTDSEFFGTPAEVSASPDSQDVALETNEAIENGLMNLGDLETSPAETVAGKIGNDARMAIVYECWYALRQYYLSHPNDEGPHGHPDIGGMTVSNWNYPASDTVAFNDVRRRYGYYSTVSSSFGTSNSYALKGGYGRGGQCTFFATLIIRRATGRTPSWSFYGSTRGGALTDVRNAQPGDIIVANRNYTGAPYNHVAIVVKRLGGGLDVVDSNWVGYRSYPIRSGYPDSELIGRHPLSWSRLSRDHYRCYSGRGRWY